MIFVYDGTIEGLFTVIFTAYEMTVEPISIYSKEQNFQTSLLYPTKSIETQSEKSERIAIAIKRISYNAWDSITTAFRHSAPEKDIAIFRYIKQLFNKKNAVFSMFNHPDIIALNTITEQVNKEINRMHGFLRFRETQCGVYYAPIAPDHNILDALAQHFSERFDGMPFCIHDTARHKMLAYDGNTCKIISAPEVDIHLSDREIVMQSIWKDYYNSVNIKERKNLRLQRQWMPVRYRKFMPELHNDFSK